MRSVGRPDCALQRSGAACAHNTKPTLLLSQCVMVARSYYLSMGFRQSFFSDFSDLSLIAKLSFVSPPPFINPFLACRRRFEFNKLGNLVYKAVLAHVQASLPTWTSHNFSSIMVLSRRSIPMHNQAGLPHGVLMFHNSLSWRIIILPIHIIVVVQTIRYISWDSLVLFLSASCLFDNLYLQTLCQKIILAKLVSAKFKPVPVKSKIVPLRRKYIASATQPPSCGCDNVSTPTGSGPTSNVLVVLLLQIWSVLIL